MTMHRCPDCGYRLPNPRRCSSCQRKHDAARPQRIQLRRSKAWRKPEGAIVVARPTCWGNPFRAVQETDGLELSLPFFGYTAHGIWNPSLIPTHWSDTIVHCVYEQHTRWLQRLGGHPHDVARAVLAGHDLACWCPPDQPCHADVLLEIANA